MPVEPVATAKVALAERAAAEQHKLLRGTRMNMSDRSRKTFRRALAGLLVAALLIGVTPPLGANEMVCKMDTPASAPEPSSPACGPLSDPRAGPSLHAASCCRFEAPSEAQSLSVTLSPQLRALRGPDAQAIAPAIASDSPDVAAASSSVRPATGDPAPSSRPTRSSILRL